MVRLFLATSKGNAGGRYFPFQGYLGLTPLRVDGLVRTKLEEDGKPLAAKSLSVHVRCYQSRVGRAGTIHSRIIVDYSKSLWQKPEHDEFGFLGDFDASFKITLPTNVPGYSTANYQEYKSFWRVEAVLEHVHIPAVGSRILRYYDLPLIRYDVPPSLNPSPMPPSPFSSMPHTLYLPNLKPSTPIVSYNLSTPVLPVGPSDLIFTSLFLRPLDTTLSIRSASVLVERRIDLHQITNPSYFTSATDIAPATADEPEFPPPLPSNSLLPPRSFFGSPSSGTPPIAISSSMPESSTSPASPLRARSPYGFTSAYSSSSLGVSAAESTYSVSSMSPLLPTRSPSPPPPLSSSSTHPSTPSTTSGDTSSRSVTATIIYGDSGGVGGFAIDRTTGIWSKTVNLSLPKAKSQNLWAMGETVKTELADVSFWVKVKVIVSTPSNGTFSLDLEPRELIVVSTNDSERRLALAKFAEQKEASERSKSKSKSPRRRRARESDGEGEHEHDRERGSDKEGGNGERGSSTDASSSSKPHRYRPVPPPIPTLPPSIPIPPPIPSATTSRRPFSPLVTSPASSIFSSRTSTDTHASGSSKKPPRSSTSSKSSRRPHTSAGPRDKSNLSSVDSGRSAMLAKNVVVVDAGRSAARSSTSAGARPPTAGSHTHTHLFTYDHEKEKEDLIRAWEEELERIEAASRRSSAGMLAFFGGAGRKLRGRLGAGASTTAVPREGKVGIGAG